MHHIIIPPLYFLAIPINYNAPYIDLPPPMHYIFLLDIIFLFIIIPTPAPFIPTLYLASGPLQLDNIIYDHYIFLLDIIFFFIIIPTPASISIPPAA